MEIGKYVRLSKEGVTLKWHLAAVILIGFLTADHLAFSFQTRGEKDAIDKQIAELTKEVADGKVARDQDHELLLQCQNIQKFLVDERNKDHHIVARDTTRRLAPRPPISP